MEQYTSIEVLCHNILKVLHGTVDEILKLRVEQIDAKSVEDLQNRLEWVITRLGQSASVVSEPIDELLQRVKSLFYELEECHIQLQKSRENFDRKDCQLNIAIRHLNLLDEKIKRISREKRVMNWEKLFTKLIAVRTHGRRWRFRIANIQRRAVLGYEHIQSMREEMDDLINERDGIDEVATYDDTPNHDTIVHHDQEETTEHIEISDDEQIYDSPNEKADEEITEDIQLRAGPIFDVRMMSENKPVMVSKSSWTHEPEFEWTLNVRVYKPEGLDFRELKCILNMCKQTHRTGVLDIVLANEDTDDEEETKKTTEKGEKTDSLPPPKHKDFEEVKFSLPDSVFNKFMPRTEDIVLRISVLYGPNEEMVAMAVVEIDTILSLDPETVTNPPPTRDDEPTYFSDGDHHEYSTLSTLSSSDDVKPILFPLQTLNLSLTSSKTKSCGNIPLYFYWSKTLKQRELNRQAGTARINEVVLEMTGIDLDVVTKESLHKETRDRAISAMSTRSEVLVETVPKSDYDSLVEKHQKEVEDIQRDYDGKISQLIDAINQLEVMNPSPSVDTGTRMTGEFSKSPSFVRKSKSRDQHVRPHSANASFHDLSPNPTKDASTSKPKVQQSFLPWNHRKNFRIGRPLPDWGATVVKDFYERLNQYDQKSRKHRATLIQQIWDEASRNIEMNLAVLNRLSRHKEVIADPLQDICIPALFMPVKNRSIFNPRAHQYFHPLGSTMKRLTQPPSVFHLPRLDRTLLARVNLFDMSSTFTKQGQTQPSNDHQA